MTPAGSLSTEPAVHIAWQLFEVVGAALTARSAGEYVDLALPAVAGATSSSLAFLYAVDPRDRPENPKKSGREPLCHAADPELKKEYKEDWRNFMDRFIEASADYRSGYFHREFPDGSFRPPLVTIYSASAL